MARRRTGAIITAGVLGICFGALSLLCGACGLMGALALPMLEKSTPATQNGNPVREFRMELDKEAPGAEYIEGGYGGWSIIQGVLWVGCGIGVLCVKPWARWGTVALAAVTLLGTIGYFGYEAAVVVPATQRIQQRLESKVANRAQPAQSNPGQQIGQYTGLTIRLCLFGGFSLVMIVLMLLPNVGRAFAGELPRDRVEDEGWGGASRRDEDWGKGRDDDRGREGIREPERW